MNYAWYYTTTKYNTTDYNEVCKIFFRVKIVIEEENYYFWLVTKFIKWLFMHFEKEIEKQLKL